MIKKSIHPSVIRSQSNIRFWKECLLDEPAFLIGNGCSAGDPDVKLASEYFTIGINRAFLIFTPVIVFWQDISLWDSERQTLLKLDSVKLCRDISDPQHRFYNYRLRNADNFRLSDSPNILYGTGATGPLAFQLAVALGCNPIVLVGYDCQYKEAKTDFYGVNRFHNPNTLMHCSRGLQWIKKIRDENVTGRTIINCSDNNVLGPKASIREVIASLPPPKGNQHYIDFLNRKARNA